MKLTVLPSARHPEPSTAGDLLKEVRASPKPNASPKPDPGGPKPKVPAPEGNPGHDPNPLDVGRLGVSKYILDARESVKIREVTRPVHVPPPATPAAKQPVPSPEDKDTTKGMASGEEGAAAPAAPAAPAALAAPAASTSSDVGKRLNGLRFTSACAGESHSLAIDASGRVYAWGRNGEGQLGLGDEKARSRPARVGGQLERMVVRAVAAATIHSAAVTMCGRVFTWGVDAGGRLGHGDGQAQCMPRQMHVPAKGRVVEVAAGREHTLFRLESGAVLACGKNGGPQSFRLGVWLPRAQWDLNETLSPLLVCLDGHAHDIPSRVEIEEAAAREALRMERITKEEREEADERAGRLKKAS